MQNLVHNRKEHLQNEQNILHNRKKEHLQNEQNILHNRKKEHLQKWAKSPAQQKECAAISYIPDGNRNSARPGKRGRDKRKEERWQTQLVKTNDNSAGRATQGFKPVLGGSHFSENRRFWFFESVEKTTLVLNFRFLFFNNRPGFQKFQENETLRFSG